MRPKSIRIFLPIVLGFVGHGFWTASAVAADAFHLEVLWTVAIETDRSGNGFEQTTNGLIFKAESTSPDGRIVFLADQIASGAHSQVLLGGADQNWSDRIPLVLKGAFPEGKSAFPESRRFFSRLFGIPTRGPSLSEQPYLSAFATGPSGKIWLAGAANAYLDMASYHHSDAYLAKLDAAGKAVWEMAYSNGARQTIQSVAPLPGENVAVVGRADWAGRVARIGPDGKQLWERPLGNDLGGVISSLPGERLAVVGFEATGTPQNRDYLDHVTLWILDGSGKTLTQTRIRDSINKSSHSYFGKVSLVTTDDAIYVTSGWEEMFSAQPVEIAKLSLDGKLLWKTLLPDTIVEVERTVRSWNACTPTLAVLPHGGVIVVCALGGQIQLYQIDPSSGAFQKSLLPLPDCQSGHSAALFLAPGKDGTMTLAGSRPPSNVAASCSWIGRLTAKSVN
jgi:hypothetical protein